MIRYRKGRRVGRPAKCNKCNHVYFGETGGAMRVMRKILFFFCADCWADPLACESFMFKHSGAR